MRWLVVMPYVRAGLMGMDFADELRALGHDVDTFAYRRDNVLYKNKSTKLAYQHALNRRLEQRCRDARPDAVLVIKGSPIGPDVVRRIKRDTGVVMLNVFPDNPLWMMPFEQIEPYDIFFTKERYALRQLEMVGLRNLVYLPMYCVPSLHHPVPLDGADASALHGIVALVGARYPSRERLVHALADYPLRIWGPGWRRADPTIGPMVAGGYVDGAAKLAIYCGATLA